MGKTLVLRDHLSPEALSARYRSSRDPVERARWQVLHLKSQAYSTAALEEVTGYCAYWIRQIIRRYNEQGERSVADRRHEHAGSTPMLTPEQQAELARALESGRAPDGALWNGPRVARWIEVKTGRAHVHDQRGWDYLIRLGFSAQSPRPRHQGGKAEEQEAFKKDAPRTRRRAKAGSAHP